MFMVYFGVLLLLLIIVGTACGFIAVVRTTRMSEQLFRVERELQRLRNQLPPTATSQPASASPLPPVAAGPSPRKPDAPLETAATTTRATPQRTARIREDGPMDELIENVRENWMIWLGGLCVALAGIFLAKYSIEQGLLGPPARITLGIITGVSLHGAAEWLRRKTGEAHPAFAALAGGGSITLFAVTLASLHLYDMISPTLAFIMLAIIALATMWLAYVHGPVLAAIGIVGAYIVPILVSSGEGRVLIALGYALVISASALLLMRYVYRPWLWWGFVIGALGWWLITLGDSNADHFRSLYLAAVGYLMLAIPGFDWFLNKSVQLDDERYDLDLYRTVEPLLERLYPIVFFAMAAAHTLSIVAESDFDLAFWVWSPLPLLVLLAARHREPLNWMPWILLAFTAFAWAIPRVRGDGILLLTAPDDASFLYYLGGTTLLFSGLAFRNLAACRFKAIWSSLSTLAPVLLLGLGYFLTSRLLVSWQWGVIALLVAIAYLGIASAAVKRSSVDSLVIWLFFGGHFAFSLAAVMVLEEAQLTLAIAVQMISTAWIIRSFNLPGLDWVLKLVVTIVVVRLTLNPWLASYPHTLHWSLWAYGGSALCAVAATFIMRGFPAIARWSEGAALHLVVLTIWAETRYWLNDGEVFRSHVTFLEAAIYASLFGALGIVYHRRSLVSENLARLFQLYAFILMGVAIASYTYILLATVVAAPWVFNSIGPTPILNLMLLAYGLPIVIGILAAQYFDQQFRRLASVFAGLAAFVYVSLTIRHLWQGTIDLSLSSYDGELYTYSAVWLIMAIATILLGTWRLGRGVYQAGMLLLALVIAKLFIVDMAGLEGLYRVASFMGLGISLLGISYLHQRIQRLQTGHS